MQWNPSRVDCITVSCIYSFYTTRICISNYINNVHFFEYLSIPRRAQLHSNKDGSEDDEFYAEELEFLGWSSFWGGQGVGRRRIKYHLERKAPIGHDRDWSRGWCARWWQWLSRLPPGRLVDTQLISSKNSIWETNRHISMKTSTCGTNSVIISSAFLSSAPADEDCTRHLTESACTRVELSIVLLGSQLVHAVHAGQA